MNCDCSHSISAARGNKIHSRDEKLISLRSLSWADAHDFKIRQEKSSSVYDFLCFYLLFWHTRRKVDIRQWQVDNNILTFRCNNNKGLISVACNSYLKLSPLLPSLSSSPQPSHSLPPLTRLPSHLLTPHIPPHVACSHALFFTGYLTLASIGPHNPLNCSPLCLQKHPGRKASCLWHFQFFIYFFLVVF